MCKQFGIQNITSSILLLSIVKKHERISSQMRDFSITLVSDGHEQEYSNGTITAYCYEARKTVRLEKN